MITLSQDYLFLAGNILNKINQVKGRGNLKLMKNNKCDICGRMNKKKIAYYGQSLCPKHYNQIKKYGRTLDTNPRTIYDKNEINVYGDIAVIDLYDRSQNKISEAIIDSEDIHKVKYYKWRLNGAGYVINTPKKQPVIFLHRIIMDTDQIVDHINHNTLDNRKSNLRIVTKSQNGMNKKNVKGISKTKKGAYYAYIKINQKMYNLGLFYEENEALFARWYAEQILFKSYAFPKREPIITNDRKKQIETLVKNKLKLTG